MKTVKISERGAINQRNLKNSFLWKTWKSFDLSEIILVHLCIPPRTWVYCCGLLGVYRRKYWRGCLMSLAYQWTYWVVGGVTLNFANCILQAFGLTARFVRKLGHETGCFVGMTFLWKWMDVEVKKKTRSEKLINLQQNQEKNFLIL